MNGYLLIAAIVLAVIFVIVVVVHQPGKSNKFNAARERYESRKEERHGKTS